MNRLTEKVKNTDDYIKLPTKDKQEFINKLGQLEDLLQSYNVKDLQELDNLLGMATAYEELSKQLGCSLDIYAKLVYDTPIYDKNGYKFFVNIIKKYEVCGCSKRYVIEAIYFSKEDGAKNIIRSFPLDNYKKTWWLKSDRSE